MKKGRLVAFAAGTAAGDKASGGGGHHSKSLAKLREEINAAHAAAAARYEDAVLISAAVEDTPVVSTLGLDRAARYCTDGTATLAQRSHGQGARRGQGVRGEDIHGDHDDHHEMPLLSRANVNAPHPDEASLSVRGSAASSPLSSNSSEASRASSCKWDTGNGRPGARLSKAKGRGNADNFGSSRLSSNFCAGSTSRLFSSGSRCRISSSAGNGTSTSRISGISFKGAKERPCRFREQPAQAAPDAHSLPAPTARTTKKAGAAIAAEAAAATSASVELRASRRCSLAEASESSGMGGGGHLDAYEARTRRLKHRHEFMKETEFGDSQYTKDAPERKRSGTAATVADRGKALAARLRAASAVSSGASLSSTTDGGGASSGNCCAPVVPTSAPASADPLVQQMSEAASHGELEMAETQTVSTVHRSLWQSTTQTVTTSRVWRARRPEPPDVETAL